jgi:hypothetical protein
LRQAYVASNVRSCTKSGWRKPAVNYQPRCRALPNHGGLTPAAPGWVFDSRCTMFDSRGAAFGSQNHGGLTPAALVNMRSSIAKIAFSSADIRAATQERGRKPPVACEHPRSARHARRCRCDSPTTASLRRPLLRMCVSILRQAYVASNVRSCTKSGWRKPAVDYQPRCRALPNHGELTPAAPVNMRSSIAKIAFSSADIRTATQERGA